MHEKAKSVTVIGAGVTGLLTAINAKANEAEVTILERSSFPNGSSVRIAGVLHSGARFAGFDDELSARCFNDWRWWMSSLVSINKKVGGYFIKIKGEADEYFEGWISSLEKIKIPHSEINLKAFGDLNLENLDRIYWTPEIQVASKEVVKALINYAQKIGVNIIYDSEILQAVKEGDEYALLIKNKDKQFKVKGKVVLAAGSGLPELAKMFELNLKYTLFQGSHILINVELPAITEIVHKPATYDLFIPAELGTYLAPTLVPYNNLKVTEDELKGIANVQRLFYRSIEALGALTASRISISEPSSQLKGGDYVYSNDGLIVLWSNNFACAPSVARKAGEILGYSEDGLRKVTL